MKIIVTQTQDTYVLKLEGDLDANSCLLVDQAIEKAVNTKPAKILIDCQNLTYISSAGVGLFVSHIHTLKTQGILFVLFNMSFKVELVFKIIGINALIPIVKSLEEAFEFNNRIQLSY
jgi:anti-sigma B factor antagonist